MIVNNSPSAVFLTLVEPFDVVVALISSKSVASSVLKILNKTFISEVAGLCADSNTLIAVAEFSKVIFFVR